MRFSMMGRKRRMTEAQTEPEEENGTEQTQGGSDGAAPASASASANTEESGSEVERLRTEAADYKDRYLRAIADMDNVRRRARMDADDAKKFANERLVSELLPVLDNFARALEAAEQSPNFDALKSGVDLIHRQLSEVLTRAGLQRIDAVGQPFDPNLHEAIMQVEPQEGQEPHEVVEELRAGYRFSDRVVRPTLVKVTSG
jgi:molecular chaperone GrpE